MTHPLWIVGFFLVGGLGLLAIWLGFVFGDEETRELTEKILWGIIIVVLALGLWAIISTAISL